MTRVRLLAATVIVVFCAFAIGGCSLPLAPRPDNSKFFVLAPTTVVSAAPSTATSGATIGVGPIKLPNYLERQEIVTRVAPNRLNLSATDRWAEGLDGNFTQVLAQDLGAALGTHRLVFFPWYQANKVNYQVRVDVYQFESDAAGRVTLTAHWQILDGAGKLLYVSDSTFSASADPKSTAAIVAAMSSTLGDLAGQIASEIASMPATKS